MRLRLANAPTSWGIEPPDPPQDPPWETVLAEIAEAGYEGTELGPLGYLPDGSAALREALAVNELRLAAGVAMLPFSVRAEHEQIAEHVRSTCGLLRAGGASTLILIDALGEDRVGTAGRPDAAPRLGDAGWTALVDGCRRAAELAAEVGLDAVFHPHVGTHVEFEDEIERLLAELDPGLVGLCVDTGHSVYAAVDPVALIRRHSERLGYVHLKDVDAGRISSARRQGWSFPEAVAHGLFRPLGTGCVDFPAVAAALEAAGYGGWATVEQDRVPDGSTTPLEEARASLAYLRTVGIAA